MTQTCGCFPTKWSAPSLKQAGKGLCKGVKRAARFIGKQLLVPCKPSIRRRTPRDPRDQLYDVQASGGLMPEGSAAATAVAANGLSSPGAWNEAHRASSAALTCGHAGSRGRPSAAFIPNPAECETPPSQDIQDVFPGADTNYDFSSRSIGHDGQSSGRLSSMAGCKARQQSFEYLPTIHDVPGGSQLGGSRRPRAYSACISESSTLSGPGTPARSDISARSVFSPSGRGLSGGRSSSTNSSRQRTLSWLQPSLNAAAVTARLHSPVITKCSTNICQCEVRATFEEGSAEGGAPESPAAASPRQLAASRFAPEDSTGLLQADTAFSLATNELITLEDTTHESPPEAKTEELTTPEDTTHDSPPEPMPDVCVMPCPMEVPVQKPAVAGAEETTPAQEPDVARAEEIVQVTAAAQGSVSVIQACLELTAAHFEAAPADEDDGSAVLQRPGRLASADAAAADGPGDSLDALLAAVSIASDGVVGFVNPRCCCYLNAVLQCLLALAAFVHPLRCGLVEQIVGMGLGHNGFEGQQVTEQVLGVFTKVLARRAWDGDGPIVLDELRAAMSATDALDLQQYASAYVQQDAVEFIGELLRYLHANGLCFPEMVSSREIRITDNMTEQMCQMLAFECDQQHSWVSEAVTSTVMTTWMCTECSRKGYRFGANRVMLVSLPAGPAAEPVSLHDCLDATLNAEAEAFSCPDCKGLAVECGDVFSRLSDGFVIALKRYEQTKGSGVYTKNSRPVTVPEELDLTRFSNIDAVEAMGGGGTKYSLCGLCHHRGITTAGHYWASTRALSDGRWRQYDDDKVLDWQCPAGPSETAYLLFYKRVQV